MTIRTKLRLSSITILVLVVIFVSVVFALTWLLQQSYQKQQLAEKITETSFQLALLQSEYLAYPGERPKAQWINLDNVQSRLLAEAIPLFTESEEKKLFEDLRLASVNRNLLFEELVKNVQEGENSTVVQEVSNQLTVKAQSQVSDVLRLSELSRQAVRTAERVSNTIVAILGASIIIIAMGLYRVTNTITKTLRALGKGTKIIADGDLSYQIDIQGNDELGRLAYLFNKMTVKLAESYATLEEKVSLRTQNLAEAKAKDEAILASLGDGIAVADETGTLIYFNKNAEDILGISTVQSSPGTWQKRYGVFDPISLKPLPTKEMPLFRAVKGETVSKVPIFIRNARVPDGKFISVTATPIILNNKSIGGVAIFRDMTKENEIDKAKNEFVSLASHQLRTPLSIAKWYTEMLLAGDAGVLNRQQQKYIGEVAHSNQRMVDLVNALLNVSRLELGAFVFEPQSTDVALLVRSAIQEQQPQIGQKKIHFFCAFAAPLPRVSADPKLLYMAVQNLLSNAIAYTPNEGTIVCSISFDANKKRLLLSLSDTGYGIPKKQQDKIFTKLFRADNAKEKDTEGTGLGLYIVKKIMEHSGGKVWFESPSPLAFRKMREEKGDRESVLTGMSKIDQKAGSTFYLSLPLEGVKKQKKDPGRGRGKSVY